MFKLKRDTVIPSVDSTVEILQKHVAKCGVPLDYDRMQEYHAYYTIMHDNLIKQIIRYTGSTAMLQYYTDSDFLQFLSQTDAIQYLARTGKGQPSLSVESVDAAIATNMISKEVATIMQMYSKAKSYRTLIGPFKKIFEAYPVVNWETFDNHRMLLVTPTAVAQNTGRVGYQAPAITNFGRVIQDIITVPKGWIKCEVDSGQIDPRLSQSWYINDKQLVHCTMMYNDAYYGYVHYCSYLTDEQRRSGVLDLQPMEITDELKAKRKKLKEFGNSVMYGSTENRLGDIDKANFIRYIGGHPERVKVQQKAEQKIMRGDYIFKTAFGTPINIMGGPSAREDLKYSAEEQFKRRVKRGINAPIQGTAADLFRYSVARADNLLLRKAPNSAIIAYVHDSGKFMISEKEYDDVIDEIKEIVSYQIEDWIPIYGEYQEGVHINDVMRFIA